MREVESYCRAILITTFSQAEPEGRDRRARDRECGRRWPFGDCLVTLSQPRDCCRRCTQDRSIFISNVSVQKTLHDAFSNPYTPCTDSLMLHKTASSRLCSLALLVVMQTFSTSTAAPAATAAACTTAHAWACASEGRQPTPRRPPRSRLHSTALGLSLIHI